MHKKNQEHFPTTDINLAATLCCCGYKIVEIDRPQGSLRAVFIIERDEKLTDLIQRYVMHRLKVDPLSFANFLKEIKTRIYNIN